MSNGFLLTPVPHGVQKWPVQLTLSHKFRYRNFSEDSPPEISSLSLCYWKRRTIMNDCTLSGSTHTFVIILQSICYAENGQQSLIDLPSELLFLQRFPSRWATIGGYDFQCFIVANGVDFELLCLGSMTRNVLLMNFLSLINIRHDGDQGLGTFSN